MNNTDEKYKVNGKASWDLAVYLNRQNPLPLDGTSIYNSLEAAQKYASENAKAYPGQIISVVTEKEVKVYKINNGKLEELGKCSLVTDKNPNLLATADNIGQIIYLTTQVIDVEVTYSPGPYIVSGVGTVSKIGTVSASGDIAGVVAALQGTVSTLESTVGKKVDKTELDSYATKEYVQTNAPNETKDSIEEKLGAWFEEDNGEVDDEVYTKAESDALFAPADEVEKKFSEQPYFGYPKSAGYHVRHTVDTPTPSSVGSRYSIVYKVCSGSKLRCQSSWGYGIFASVYDSVDKALIGNDDEHLLQMISDYTKTPIVDTINVDGYLRIGTRNVAGTAISDSDILDFESSLTLSIIGSIINNEIAETNEAVAETRLMIVGSKKNYIIGKKYSNRGSLVDDPDYTAITELIPVKGGSTVTFSLGTSILLFKENKTYDDYFSQGIDPRTVTLKNTSVFIGVSFPTSRLSNVSLVINGVNHPIVLIEDVLGAAEARGTSFEKDGSFIDSDNVQGAITKLSEKMFPSSFVFGKMLEQLGALADSADGGYCTEFIEVLPNQKIVVNTRTVDENRVAIVVYDASKAAFNYYNQTEANRVITVPYTSAYIRFNYENSMLNQLLLTDLDGNSLIPVGGINGNFIRYYDEEELGANNVQDAIKAVVKEVRNPVIDVIDIVKMYKDKEYARNNLVFKSDFSCFFFSDAHGSANNINRIVTLAKAWSEYVDCIINGGDTIFNNSGESITWYQNIVNTAGQDGVEILTAIGNHDAYTPTGSDGPLNSYNKYIKPTIDNVPDIVQPANAETVGKCYYYKDYNEKVRVIVLDAYSPNAYWDSDEEAWLVSVLADAKTNNLAVLCVTHVPPSEENFTRIPCTFSSVLSVERWVISPGALSAVQDFIDAGGIFSGWLCGHTHYDVFGYPTGKQGQHMFVTMSARYDYGPDGFDDGFDTPRSGDDTKIDYDSFNLVAVDTENSLFKVLRIGVNLDFKMHTKNVLVYDYANREVISNW